MKNESEAATMAPSQLGFQLPAGDSNDVTGLSTILVASIQEVKDRMSHIEFVFCSQLYPNFQSDALSKRRRIEHLEREAEQNITLHKRLLDHVQSKDCALRDAEDKRNAAFKRIDELDEKLRAMAREFDEKVEVEGRLLQRVEALARELETEKAKRNRLNEAYKRLKSQHVYLRRKVGLNEENVVSQNKSETASELGMRQSPIVEPDPAFENPSITMGACEAAEESSEIPELDFGGLEKITPDVFVATHDINEVKEKASEDDRGANLSSSSGFRDVPKCLSTKLVSVSNTKRSASFWRQTRSHQSRAGPDPHDDFLDTPLENIRANLNKEDLLHGIQKDISEDSSDDETQDINAKSSPQKKQKQSSIADDETQDMNAKSSPQNKQKQSSIADDETQEMNAKSSPQKNQKQSSVTDDETQDMNAKSSPQTKQKQSSITVTNKRSFKYVEPVRKKAERENLKGVECKQCRKFYDAVLPNADGKDADSSKQNFRCEHLDGVSRHRYRYVPPMTPEGFWNIGFESEM